MKKIFKKMSKGGKKVMDISKDICRELVNNKEEIFVLSLAKDINKEIIGATKGACKEIVNNDKARLVLGLTLTSLGLGLLASAYIKVPQ